MIQPSSEFESLGLNGHLLQALQAIGYETPSPIQAQSIPPLLAGRDVLGQAQTGTGKTAAFALPVLQNLDTRAGAPQVLVLTPTRELAIQVAEAFQKYAQFIPGFHVLPIYGGSAYDKQIRGLKRGVHVVVGTPGRVMDHMRKGTLKLNDIKQLVLDEADEMLRMGFIDAVEWILSHTPEQRQIALFSATMPRAIAQVAKTYLRDPVQVKTEVQTTTAETIRQRYWLVSGIHKLDALTRVLEVETFDAMIIFVRTKTATVELAEKLEARGFSSAALNGDISQVLRERTVERLKNGQVDILVATDVAARGLDVERISHVLNYDIPYDTEAYVHRIGRTGRAGRTGDAILFVAKREMRMLRSIEKATSQPISPMSMPSSAAISEQRVSKFKQRVNETLTDGDLEQYEVLFNELVRESELDAPRIAAALVKMAQTGQPLFATEKTPVFREEANIRDRDGKGKPAKKRSDERKTQRSEKPQKPDVEMDTYRVEVGRADGVKPGDIVGAIANEADIDSQFIGHIRINDDYCTVDLPSGMPPEVFRILRKTWVCQKQLNISRVGETEVSPGKKPLEKRRRSFKNDASKSDAGDRKIKKMPRQKKR